MTAVLAALVMFAGAALFAIGRRGRRVDLHLICRACGFDLFNRPETSHRCPECGADTRRRRSMRVGNRQPRRVLRATGLAMTLLAGGGLAASISLWAARADWIAWEPVAALRTQMVSTSAHERIRASGELMRRIRHGRGSAAEITATVDQLLTLQGSAPAPGGRWYRQWGDIVQTAISSGRATPAQTQRYVDQMMRVTFAVRPRVDLDDPVPVEVRCDFRGGTELGPLGSALVKPELRVTAGDASGDVALQNQSLDSIVPIPLTFTGALSPQPGTLAAGAHLLHIDCRFRVELQSAGSAAVSVERHVDLALEVLAAGESSVELTPNPQAAAALAAAVRVLPGDPRHASLGWLNLADPPTAAALTVTLRQGGHAWIVGRVAAQPNGFARVPLMLADGKSGAPPARPGPAVLEFTPDPDLAKGTVDMTSIWAGTFRVPVVVPGGSKP